MLAAAKSRTELRHLEAKAGPRLDLRTARPEELDERGADVAAAQAAHPYGLGHTSGRG